MPKRKGFTLEEIRAFTNSDSRTMKKVLKEIGFVRRVKYIAGETKRVYYPLTDVEAATIIKAVRARRTRFEMRRAGLIF